MPIALPPYAALPWQLPMLWAAAYTAVLCRSLDMWR